MVVSEETREKIRQSKLGTHLSEETKAKLSKLRRGKRPSLETRIKLSIARRARVMPPISEETKAKIKASWTEERKAKTSAAMSARCGSLSHMWRGGVRTNPEGYVKIYCPSHPFCDGGGYVMEHRLVAERALGKYLDPKNVVHHINKNVADNRNENLVICEDDAYHKLIHKRMKEQHYAHKTDKQKKIWS